MSRSTGHGIRVLDFPPKSSLPKWRILKDWGHIWLFAWCIMEDRGDQATFDTGGKWRIEVTLDLLVCTKMDSGGLRLLLGLLLIGLIGHALYTISSIIVRIARSLLGSVFTVYYPMHAGRVTWPWAMGHVHVHVSQIRNTCVHTCSLHTMVVVIVLALLQKDFGGFRLCVGKWA